jgi:MFS family permease
LSLSRAGAAVAALAVAAFCFGTTESLPIGLLPQISSGLHVSPSAVGLIVTGYGLVVAAASVPLARLTANVRRRRLLAVVMALFVAATVQHRHRRRRRAGRFDPSLTGARDTALAGLVTTSAAFLILAVQPSSRTREATRPSTRQPAHSSDQTIPPSGEE